MKRLFYQDSSLGFKTIVFLLVALLFMFFDHYNDAFHRFRNHLSMISLPFQYIVAAPIDFMNDVVSDFSSYQSVQKENAKLRAQIVLLNAELQKQYSIEAENQQLQALLQSSQNDPHYRLTVARLMAISSDPMLKEVVLNKGEKDGAFTGQPVMDAFGVMGQVIAVEPSLTRVMLISDRRSAIPVQIQRNGVRAIAIGMGQDRLKLNDLSETKDVRVGDVVITSGLGGRFPLGYPVGKVIAIHNNPTGQFSDIDIAPAAHLSQSRLVLLLWPKLAKSPKGNS